MDNQRILKQVAEQAYKLGQSDKEHGVFVPFRFLDVCNGNAYDALLLSQIVYWSGNNKKGKPRNTYTREGEQWIVKTYDEWKEELHFNSARTVEQCMKRLSDSGLVIKESHKSRLPNHDGKKVLHVRINSVAIYAPTNNQTTYHVGSETTYHVGSETTYHVEPSVETNVKTNVDDDPSPPASTDDVINPDVAALYEAFREKVNIHIPYRASSTFRELIDEHGIDVILRAVDVCAMLGGKSWSAYERVLSATQHITDESLIEKARKTTYEKASGNDRTAYFVRVLEGLREIKFLPEPQERKPKYFDAQEALSHIEIDYGDEGGA